MVNIQLTQEQWEQIKRDAEGTNLLTEEEIEKIARKLQTERNLPFVSEEKEFVVFVKIVRSLDHILYKNLPNEIYETIWDPNSGISEREKNRLVKSLTKYVNDKIDIPYLPEWSEKILIKGFLHLIANALLKGKSLENVMEEEIPE
ncbi:MAG: hypothetical protein CL840_21345 [Crocinitomicaceae bacterium]|nr:hypothetical protein [Crocinitomicaceae bacterium]|tara:strand:- start:35476 stop:35913 length:438 start_codon:yes stop_codon:yes gene_type:complete